MSTSESGYLCAPKTAGTHLESRDRLEKSKEAILDEIAGGQSYDG
jgi:hypothetical protein